MRAVSTPRKIGEKFVVKIQSESLSEKSAYLSATARRPVRVDVSALDEDIWSAATTVLGA